jgi:hypothetical protein
MNWITRLLLRRFRAPERFLSLAVRMYILMWKGVYTMPETCKVKHEEVTTRYCPGCGTEVNDPDTDRIKGLIKTGVEEVLAAHGIIKPKTNEPETKKKRSIAETFGGKGEKK